MARNVLVVAAHPDDEALGCGGAMARHATEGDQVSVLFLSAGVGSRADGGADVEIAARKQSAAAAAAALGGADIRYGEVPDNAADTVPLLSIAQLVESAASGRRIDVVYTHHAHDLNVDHRAAHEAVLTAFRPQPHSTSKPTILAFETASSTEWRTPSPATVFAPNWFVDISSTLDAKLRALDAYAQEMRPWPHARSAEAVRALARWRGASIGVEAAEAFMLVRAIR